MTRIPPSLAAAVMAVACAATAAAQGGGGGGVPPSYGHNFVTIGAVGNAAYTSLGQWGFGQTVGRGRVDHAYRIDATEVTTAQWLEFVNTFSTQPKLALDPRNSWLLGPTMWGAATDGGYAGPGFRYRLRSDLPDAGRTPVYGATWNASALYCNWLHHGKTSDWATIQDGAYDASRFGYLAQANLNPQLTHAPGARYWIPSLDEWMKAAFYDPDRYGPGQAGWWDYPNRLDRPAVPGLPGQGETSAQIPDQPGFGEFYIPVGSYPDQRSPWGLLDSSGGAHEWVEDLVSYDHRLRAFKGTRAGRPNGVYNGDLVDDMAWSVNAGFSAFGSGYIGLRIASAIPAPGTGVFVIFGVMALGRRTRVPAARRA